MRERMRNVCFTAWNIDVEYDAEYMTYLVSGLEVCPSSGKEHYQGYVELKRPTDFSVVKRLLGGDTHLEKRQASAEKASNYCKKDNNFKEYGTISKQGKRRDLEDVIEDIQIGTSIRTVARGHPEQYIKYHRGIEKLRNFYIEPRNWVTKVHILHGATGTGKSRTAREKCLGNPYWVWTPQRGEWFDGYDGQEYVIMEEFEGQMPYKTMLTLLDRYECPVQVKGGFVEFCPKTIIITSSKKPADWYPLRDINELMRRITDVVLLGTEGTEVVEGNTIPPPESDDDL